MPKTPHILKNIRKRKDEGNEAFDWYAHRSAQRGVNMKRGKIVPAICNILGTLILLSVIATFLPVTIPRLMGYEVYHILTGSMEPSIPVGSLVYVEPAVPTDIQEDEVIAYHSGGATVTHRVVQNRMVEGEFVTKGDANAQEDLNTIPYTSLVGRVKYHIPFLGQILVIYTSGVGKIYIICYAACGVMFNMLATRLRDRARERQKEQQKEDRQQEGEPQQKKDRQQEEESQQRES